MNLTSIVDRLQIPRRRIEGCPPSIGDLMVRYFILRTPKVAIYVHHFLRSDNERHFHDHPWTFITIPFSCGYWEHIPVGEHLTGKQAEQIRWKPGCPYSRRIWRRRFFPLYRPAEWKHWVEVTKPTWTLVIRFRRRRMWGFDTANGWMDWRSYGRDYCE